VVGVVMAVSCCVASDNVDRTRFVASAVAVRDAVLCASYAGIWVTP